MENPHGQHEISQDCPYVDRFVSTFTETGDITAAVTELTASDCPWDLRDAVTAESIRQIKEIYKADHQAFTPKATEFILKLAKRKKR